MSDRISNGEWLTPGRKKVSPNGKTELRMQDDGKIAVYREGECLWQNTPNQRDDIVGVRMQQDGNLCMYDTKDQPVWHTNTAPKGSSVFCLVQDDGNVCLYAESSDTQALWASQTWVGA